MIESWIIASRGEKRNAYPQAYSPCQIHSIWYFPSEAIDWRKSCKWIIEFALNSLRTFNCLELIATKMKDTIMRGTGRQLGSQLFAPATECSTDYWILMMELRISHHSNYSFETTLTIASAYLCANEPLKRAAENETRNALIAPQTNFHSNRYFLQCNKLNWIWNEKLNREIIMITGYTFYGEMSNCIE